MTTPTTPNTAIYDSFEPIAGELKFSAEFFRTILKQLSSLGITQISITDARCQLSPLGSNGVSIASTEEWLNDQQKR